MFWEGLGLSRTRLGRSWAPLGRSWASLGRLLGVPWALLGISWASWAHLGRFGFDLEGFQGGFGRVLGEIQTSK